MKLLRPTSSSSLLKQIAVELINVRVHQTETLKSTATSSFPAVPGLLCLGLSVTLYCVRIQKTLTKRYSLATCHSPRGSTFKTTTNPTLLSPWTLLARHTRNNRVFFFKKKFLLWYRSRCFHTSRQGIGRNIYSVRECAAFSCCFVYSIMCRKHLWLSPDNTEF
jgi:hypothetical protein